jgi:hypothetical protein
LPVSESSHVDEYVPEAPGSFAELKRSDLRSLDERFTVVSQRR